MTIIGYARVSTTDQDLSLRAAGCEAIRAEKRSGTTTQGREELRIVLDFLRPGETCVGSGSWKASPRPRRLASIEAGSPP